MKRPNSFLVLSEKSRVRLMKFTGMDELDYHLAILEGGCQLLEALAPEDPRVSREEVLEYRQTLTTLGYWKWFEHAFRTMEIAVVGLWTSEGSVVPYQDNTWRRQLLLDTIAGMRFNAQVNAQFDCWLKYQDRTVPQRQEAPVPQEQH